jgi:hypothetical protein
MKTVYVGQVNIAEMASAFPRTIQPSFSHTDYIETLTPNTIQDASGVKIDPLLGCLYALPVFVPHNQVNTSSETIIDDGLYINGDLPEVDWHTLSITGGHATQAFKYRPFAYQHFDVQAAEGVAAESMMLSARTADFTFPCSGFWAFLNRNHYNNVDANSAAPPAWEVQFTCNDALYSVVGTTHYSPLLRVSLDGGSSWSVLNNRLRTGGSPLSAMGNTQPENNSEVIYIEVMALNGKLAVSVSGQSPFIVALLDDPSYPAIQNVAVKINNFTQCSWHVHPMKFLVDSTYTSSAQQIGFVPDVNTPLRFTVNGLIEGHRLESGENFTENGGQVTITQADGTDGTAIAQYTLDIANPITGTYVGTGYADTTVAVSRVTMRVRPIYETLPYTPRQVIPKRVEESIVFDLNTLSIRHNVAITLSNWQGIDYWAAALGMPTFGSGNVAVSLRYGWQHFPPASDGGVGYPRFFGFCNRFIYSRPASNIALLTMQCVDQMQQLQDSLLAAPPDLDGANHYAAIAWLALKAGISPLQLAFADLVPTIGGTLYSDPYGEIDFFAPSPGLLDEQQYFLPYGIGMNPWTPVNRSLPILEMMEFIRKATGYLLFFDEQGYMRYEPWIPPSPDTIPKRIFTEVPTDGNDLPGGALTEMRNLVVTSGTENTRNQVILIGIDSYSSDWHPLVEKREDSDSIHVYPGQVQPRNYIGYPKPFVWMDSRFADAGFAAQAADKIAAILALPDYTVEFETWMQPDIYPMDVIWVVDSRSNSGGIPFYVMSTHTVMSAMGPQIELTTRITGKFLI